MSHRENVRIVREAFKTISVKKWEAGDAALAEAPRAEHFENNDAEAKITALAEEAGVSARALIDYRQVAFAWPPNTRVLGVAWSIHREIRGDERFTKLADYQAKAKADSRKLTVDYVRALLGHAVSHPELSGDSQKPTAKAVQKAIAENPKIAEAAVNDRKTAKILEHELAKKRKRQTEAYEAHISDLRDKETPREKQSAKNMEIFALSMKFREALQNARKEMMVAAQTIVEMGGGEVRDETRDEVVEHLDHIHNSEDAIRAAVTGGVSFEAALEALLALGE